jgi:hypothetical protein
MRGVSVPIIAYYTQSYLINLLKKNDEEFTGGEIREAYSKMFKRSIMSHEADFMSYKIVLVLMLVTKYHIDEFDHIMTF